MLPNNFPVKLLFIFAARPMLPAEAPGMSKHFVIHSFCPIGLLRRGRKLGHATDDIAGYARLSETIHMAASLAAEFNKNTAALQI